MANPVEIVKGRIVDYDERSGELVIRARYEDIATLTRREYRTVDIRLNDSRPLSDKQRRNCYAMLREIAEWQGDEPDATKDFLKLEYIAQQGLDMMDNFSLSNAPMSLVAGFQRWLARFILRWDVPTRQSLLSYVDDVTDYVYACTAAKKCCVCGAKADIHHVDAVGMGRNRKTIIHEGMRVLPLCRIHHGEIHQMGKAEFLKRYHLPDGIEADKTICRLYKLKERSA